MVQNKESMEKLIKVNTKIKTKDRKYLMELVRLHTYHLSRSYKSFMGTVKREDRKEFMEAFYRDNPKVTISIVEESRSIVFDPKIFFFTNSNRYQAIITEHSVKGVKHTDLRIITYLLKRMR